MKLELYQSWHRLLGFILALFLIGLAVTGVLINHAERLGLDRYYLDSEWLLQWYEIQPHDAPVSFKVNADWVTSLDGHLYLNAAEVVRHEQALRGAVSDAEMYIVVLENELILLTHGGKVIETMKTVDGVPRDIRQAGRTSNNQIVLSTAGGMFTSNAELEVWQAVSPIPVEWSVAAPPPDEVRTGVMESFRGQGMTLEKLVLDLHSGRILGGTGIYLSDILAVLLVISVISGLLMWYKKKKMLAALKQPAVK